MQEPREEITEQKDPTLNHLRGLAKELVSLEENTVVASKVCKQALELAKEWLISVSGEKKGGGLGFLRPKKNLLMSTYNF